MKAFLLIISFGIGLISFPLYAETPGEMAQEAQNFYQASQYQKALEKWQELSSLGYINGSLFYNMANAYWRTGQVGQARRYLLKAVTLEPRNKEIHSNLDFIHEKLGIKPVEGDGPIAILKGMPWWRLSLNFYEALRMAAVAGVLFFGFLIWNLIQNKRTNRFWGILLGGIFCLALILAVPKIYGYYFHHRSIVIQSQAPLLKAPASEALTGKNFKEGTEVQVLKKQGDFRLVKSASGEGGWVEAHVLGEV